MGHRKLLHTPIGINSAELLHTPIGINSAARAAAVFYQVSDPSFHQGTMKY